MLAITFCIVIKDTKLSMNIGSKSAEFVVGSDSIVTLTHSEGQHSSLRLFRQYATKTNERQRNVHTKQKRIKDYRKKMYLREQKSI